MSENSRIKLFGWEEGMQKVNLTLLQRYEFNIPLGIAKRNVDKLLNDEEVYLEFSDLEETLSFIEKAKNLGVSSITIM
ncbi:hypothetical protein V9L05_17050 [Bernardetia sp. Wsw4-3y2]|uniref:hypothetical protein n=1 Tax=Bernardetia sp. Wsw4-3y2 TaxID=3127471 RepID=UPI0030D60481